jgi:serine/threonine protein kinase
MNAPGNANLHLTIVAADGLYKGLATSSPEPFVTVTRSNELLGRTNAVPKTIHPRWDESFAIGADSDDILVFRVFDQKKHQKTEQGFLGFCQMKVGAVIDLATDTVKTVTRDLSTPRKGKVVKHGTLTLSMSTRIHPLRRNTSATCTPPPGIAVGSRGPQPSATSSILGRSSSSLGRISISRNTGDSSSASPIDKQASPVTPDTSDAANRAWKERFSEPCIRLELSDPAPFVVGRRLGGGGVGIVVETHIDGIALALKRTYPRKLTTDHLNEISILQQIKSKQHKHIVELIGSYVHSQRPTYELGLLIWPVARCDLAIFLQDIGCLRQWVYGHTHSSPDSETETNVVPDLETLSAVTGYHQSQYMNGPNSYTSKLHEASVGVLYSRFGCLASAVAWIHNQDIRHKDLKPSQVLLSQQGLWLTDFGWSIDTSEIGLSQTSGGDNITFKYQSPERAQKAARGRPEDVFGLGCIFIEMLHELAMFSIPSTVEPAPWHDKGWYFQANNAQILDFLETLVVKQWYGSSLATLVMSMLSSEPDSRPVMDDVVRTLSIGGLFSTCCTPLPTVIAAGWFSHRKLIHDLWRLTRVDLDQQTRAHDERSHSHSGLEVVLSPKQSLSPAYTPAGTAWTEINSSQTFAPPPTIFHDETIINAVSPQRAVSFRYTTTQPTGQGRKLFKSMTSVLNGLNNQVEGLLNSPGTGRNIMTPSPSSFLRPR